MENHLLVITIEEAVGPDIVDPLNELNAIYGDDVQVIVRPNTGLQASILLMGISSIAIFVGGIFLKKITELAAADCYDVFKKAIAKVWQRYFGENPEAKMIIFSAGGKKVPETEYSLVFSLYCESTNGENIKFLYKTEWSEVEFNIATEKYLRLMAQYFRSGNGKLTENLAKRDVPKRLYLVAWDHETETLISVPSYPREILEPTNE